MLWIESWDQAKYISLRNVKKHSRLKKRLNNKYSFEHKYSAKSRSEFLQSKFLRKNQVCVFLSKIYYSSLIN